MKNFILLTFFIFILNYNFCNEDTLKKRNIVYLNIGGSSVMHSFNFENKFLYKGKLNLAISTGIGYIHNFSFLSLPLNSVVILKINKIIYSELQFGYSFIRGLDNSFSSKNEKFISSSIYQNVSLGLRFQNEKNRLMFKIGFSFNDRKIIIKKDMYDKNNEFSPLSSFFRLYFGIGYMF